MDTGEDSNVRVVYLAHSDMTAEAWNERFGAKKEGE
jgi:hypothetical protein